MRERMGERGVMNEARTPPIIGAASHCTGLIHDASPAMAGVRASFMTPRPQWQVYGPHS
jgi:hypothetical protein